MPCWHVSISAAAAGDWDCIKRGDKRFYRSENNWLNNTTLFLLHSVFLNILKCKKQNKQETKQTKNETNRKRNKQKTKQTKNKTEKNNQK